MNIDFIGDVHGHKQLLEKMLVKLDYELVNGTYMHPIQKTVFVGDIINIGPRVKQTLKMIFNMHRAGQAQCILGNHEVNLIAYQIHKKKPFLTREQVLRIERQLEATLLSFKNDWSKLNYYIDWIKEFPVYLEDDLYRVVHACWNNQSIDYLNTLSQNHTLSSKTIINLMNVNSKEYGLLHTLFRGIDIPIFENGANTSTRSVRIRWWNTMENKTYREIATKERSKIPDVAIPKGILTDAYSYHPSSRLLFVGHYCLDELPHLVSKNVCCLDFCVTRKGVLTAYRLLSERKLKHEHLYYVHY